MSDPQPAAPGRQIVVGVDGSAPAAEALRWAFALGSATGASVAAVIAWAYPSSGGWTIGAPGFDWADNAQETLAQAVQDALGDGAAAQVELRVREGHPAAVLLHEAEQADHVVVGSRGRGGFTGMLLGSVSSQVVHHTRCPVTVVRERSEPDQG